MKKMKSPFEYSSPEAMTASDVIELFVPVFGEYHNIPNIGHTFINGPRGSGKSMNFGSEIVGTSDGFGGG